MKIYNGTQHEITFYSAEQTYSVQDGRKLILNEGATPTIFVPAGTNLNCVKSNAPAPQLQSLIPLKGAVIFTKVDDLLPGYDIYIVSQLYRAACKELGRDTSRLATVDGTVYESESSLRPCGCLSLAVG